MRRGCSVLALNRHVNNRWPNEVALYLASTHWDFNPCEGIDVVFHLAGKAHALAEVEQGEEEYWRINTEGTRKLLLAAQEAGVKRFIGLAVHPSTRFS